MESKQSTILDKLFADISKQSSIEVTKEEVKEAVVHLQQEGFLMLSGDVRNPAIKRIS